MENPKESHAPGKQHPIEHEQHNLKIIHAKNFPLEVIIVKLILIFNSLL